MKVNFSIEVRMSADGAYGNAMTLGETQQIELSTLSDAAAILVHLHELFEEVAKKASRR